MGTSSINGLIPMSSRIELTALKYKTSVSDPSYTRKYFFNVASEENIGVRSANILLSLIHHTSSLIGKTVLNTGTPP